MMSRDEEPLLSSWGNKIDCIPQLKKVAIPVEAAEPEEYYEYEGRDYEYEKTDEGRDYEYDVRVWGWG